jgi:hypothetical protein
MDRYSLCGSGCNSEGAARFEGSWVDRLLWSGQCGPEWGVGHPLTEEAPRAGTGAVVAGL